MDETFNNIEMFNTDYPLYDKSYLASSDNLPHAENIRLEIHWSMKYI